MFNSYTTSAHSRHSPGLILITHILPRCVDRGLAEFDLGPGRASYKTFFCRETDGLVDAFLPVSWRGWAATPLLRAAYAVKREIKASPKAWALLQRLRRVKSGA
jgi:CelD/BcsL family acetyltransferase involved in cellulose biosynthesis